MAENSNIEWTDHTFNPWRGCQKVSAACKNCYAETRSNRFGEDFAGQRILLSDAGWREPVKWNRIAADLPDKIVKPGSSPVEYLPVPRPRVFCASLADVFEGWDQCIVDHNGHTMQRCVNCGSAWAEPDPLKPMTEQGWKGCCSMPSYLPMGMNDVRRRLFDLIDATPALDWLLLTKRPENISRMWPYRTDAMPVAGVFDEPPRRYRQNVWLGTTVENQEQAEKRIPELLECRDVSPVLFLSCEPLLGPVDLSVPWAGEPEAPTLQVDWVIAGGESGPNARPSHPDWFRSIRDQCDAAGVPFHFKQWGEWRPDRLADSRDLLDARKEVILRENGSTTSGLLPYDATDYVMRRVGKQAAGRLLDGIEHNGLPEVTS